MSRVKEKQSHVCEVEVGIICDMCGKRSEGSDWSTKDRGREKITLEHHDTETYPEDTFGKRLTLDFCPECLEKKIFPWLASQGVKLEYRDLPD